MAIEITDKAVDEVRRMMHKEGVQAAGLRVGVKGGGCSGLSYNLSFETQARTGDKVFERCKVDAQGPGQTEHLEVVHDPLVRWRSLG